MGKIIELIDVTKNSLISKKKKNSEDKDNKILDKINLSIEEGEVVSILGDLSSGNKELIYVMSTLDTISSGMINCNDKRTDWMSEKDKMDVRLQEYGIILNEDMLIDNLNVEDNIRLLQGMNDAEAEEDYANDIIKTLAVDEIKEKNPRELSDVEYKKAVIATILLKQPKIIFAEDFVMDLEEDKALECIQILVDLAKKYHITLVYATSNDKVAEVADRVEKMSQGKMRILM